MTDPDFRDKYPDYNDAELMFSCASSPSEWVLLAMMSEKESKIVPFFGTHPWYSKEYAGSADFLKLILEDDKRACVGEIGLDVLHGDYKTQMNVFLDQLRLASRLDRPVSIHMVGREKETLDALRSIKVRAILHSFVGPESYVKPFAECGCYFSISPRILKKSKRNAKRILDAIPRDRILIETDAPSCYKICNSMSEYIGKLAWIMEIEPKELISLTTDNAKRLIA